MSRIVTQQEPQAGLPLLLFLPPALAHPNCPPFSWAIYRSVPGLADESTITFTLVESLPSQVERPYWTLLLETPIARLHEDVLLSPYFALYLEL